MDFDEYQQQASTTDQMPGTRTDDQPDESLFTPLLGLAGETGTLLTEYKKKVRDKENYKVFKERVSEELGDILWYLANIATKEGLSLDSIAESNIYKVKNRWIGLSSSGSFDSECPRHEQLPNQFEIEIKEDDLEGSRKVTLFMNGTEVGNTLTDNNYEDDGYKFHDVFHLAYVAVLGWSPVIRKLLNCKRRSDPMVDEVEDGGRAQVIDEAISALVFSEAKAFNYFEGVDSVEFELLKTIERLTSHLEVSNRNHKEWESAILQGFAVWRQIRNFSGGTVLGDFETRSISFRKPQ